MGVIFSNEAEPDQQRVASNHPLKARMLRRGKKKVRVVWDGAYDTRIKFLGCPGVLSVSRGDVFSNKALPDHL